MRTSPWSCSDLIVCTAIICLDLNFYNYSFLHITKCTPTSLNLNPNLHLIPKYNDYLYLEHKYKSKGFICSHCTRSNLILSNTTELDKCSKQITKIALKYYCKHSFLNMETKKNVCQCLSTNETIPFVRHWGKSIIKLSKSHMNVNRVNQINASSSYILYFLTGFPFLLIIFGGIFAMIFYYMKLKFIQ